MIQRAMFGRFRSVVLGLLLAPMVACEETANLQSTFAEIEVNPWPGTELRYENYVFDVSGRLDPTILAVRNLGTGPLIFRSLAFEGDGSPQFRVSSAPQQIPAGGDGEIFLRFEPTETGTHTADFVLRSNDSNESVLRWPVQGFAREACNLAVSPPHQAFEVNELRVVDIAAESSRDCIITDITVDRTLFEIDSPEIPFVVRAGQTSTITVAQVGLSSMPGRPIRQLIVKEAEGTERAVSLEGTEPQFGCFTVFPTRLVFPIAPPGEVLTDQVRITNQGCREPATVLNASVSIGTASFSVPDRFPRVLGPGQSTDVTVEYRPRLETGDLGLMTIFTDDASASSVVVSLAGQAAVPELEVFPRSVDFGEVAFRNPRGEVQRSECSSSGKLVQLYSVGEAPVVLEDIYIDQQSDNLFQITSVTVAGQPVDFSQPFSVPREEQMLVALSFSPTRMDPALHRATLVFDHNVGNGRTEVRLSGQGGPDGDTEDVFQQLPGPKADILWVIDDSGSMFDEQARLIANLSRFVDYAEGVNSDYQMAVTTTDGNSPSAGKFETGCFPAPSIVGSSYEDVEARKAAFACLFNVGLAGSGLEMGMAAAKAALERALDPDLSPNTNRGFVRDDASLAIVIVSDEDDSSLLPDDLLRDYFFSVKGNNRDRVRVHTIAFPTDTFEGCEDSLFGTPGYRYRRISQQTNGLNFNICQDDWEPILSNLGIDTFVPLDTWDLTRQADPSTMRVTVNGVLVRQDNLDGWSYSGTTNALTIRGTQLPPPGAEIRVSYQGLCRP